MKRQKNKEEFNNTISEIGKFLLEKMDAELLNETNNNPTNSQLTDWAETKHSTENISYSDLINSSGGSMKVGVENKATILVLPKSIQKQLIKIAIKNNN